MVGMRHREHHSHSVRRPGAFFSCLYHRGSRLSNVVARREENKLVSVTTNLSLENQGRSKHCEENIQHCRTNQPSHHDR